MPSKRQLQIAKLVQHAVSQVFQAHGQELWDDAFVTITTVNVTPDLAIARVYISVMNYPFADELIRILKVNAKTIRKLVGEQIKNQVRHIPELEFYHDASTEEAFRMEELFKKLREERGDEEQDPEA